VSFAVVTFRFILLSLIAIGGANAVVSIVHAQLVGSGTIDEVTFARLYAVSQFAPGPNVLYVPLVGWTLAGAAGAAVDLCAFIVPPAILAVSVDRILRRRGDVPFVRSVRRASRLLAGAVLSASGFTLIAALTHGSAVAVAVSAAAFAVALGTNVNVLWCLAGAAVVGAIVR
jgi:chromate transporter